MTLTAGLKEVYSFLFLAEFLFQRQEKVLVGTEEGMLNVFNWKQWGNLSDRITVLRSDSQDKVIEAVAKVTEDVVCVATDDGKIR